LHQLGYSTGVKARRQSIVSMLALSCVVSAAARAGAATTAFGVTNNGMSSFSINGAANPTLTLIRGQTYVFSVTAVGHPFWITTARGAGDTEANAFSDGVTGNGASPGTLPFAVPASAPAMLFYPPWRKTRRGVPCLALVLIDPALQRDETARESRITPGRRHAAQKYPTSSVDASA
jgi:hypothetical protein